MERPTREAVLAAIDILYHGSATGQDFQDQMHQASIWLDEFQKSLFAWEISDQLLYLNNDLESSYFAAQTMRRKVQSQFGEVPVKEHESLRDSLINHLEKLNQSSKAMVTQLESTIDQFSNKGTLAVLTGVASEFKSAVALKGFHRARVKLCLALADLALQTPRWQNPVGDIVQKFGDNIQLLPVGLELLAVLPEELNSHQIKIGANRREEFVKHLNGSASAVLQLLTHCHKSCPHDEKVQCKIFQCFGSWLTLGFFPPEEVASSQLLKSAFDILLSHDTTSHLHDAVTDCLSNALYVSEDLEKQYPLAEVCFNFVISLSDSYEKALRDDDFDRILNYARLFTEMAESFLYTMIYSPDTHPGHMKILDFLLSCVANPHHEVAEVTFSFWYNFADMLHKEGNARSYEVLGPYVQRLLILLCGRCELDKSYEGVPDPNDDFQEFRCKALEVVQDLAYVVGSTVLFKELLEKVVSQKQSWNVVEAGLVVIHNIVRGISRNEPIPIQALQFLLSLPANVHIAVQHAAVQLAAELSYWVSDKPEYVESLFQFILGRLGNKQLATVAAHAFEVLCNACGSRLVKHFDVILQVSKAADSFPISTECVVGILKGAAHVLSLLPLNDIRKGLTELCHPQLSPLSQVLQGPANSRHTDPVALLDRLAVIFRHTAPEVPHNETHPCLEVIEEMWPVLSGIAERFKSEERIMERCCRCLRFAIRCVGQSSGRLLQPLVSQMVAIYGEYQHSCFLYLGSILVDEYGSNRACVPGLLQMLKAFSVPTFHRLAREGGLVAHPDTVDDFFRLCIRFLQHCPLEFLQNDSVDTVLRLAAASITLDHREANASVTKFLVDMIRCCQDSRYPNQGKLAKQVFDKHGADIVKGIIDACAGRIQTFMLPEVGDVLWEVLAFERENALNWLQLALKQLPNHGPTGTLVASPQQISEFYQAIAVADSVKVVWRAFREFSRLYC